MCQFSFVFKLAFWISSNLRQMRVNIFVHVQCVQLIVSRHRQSTELGVFGGLSYEQEQTLVAEDTGDVF